MSKISVVIPTYNAEKTILTTVNSVLQQTYQDLEIIVINDGSSDRTEEILATIKDSRLKVYTFANEGLSQARNRGIDLATGDYISFLDADDCWKEDKLADQLLALEKYPQAGLAYSWVYFQYETEANSYADTSGYFMGDVYGDLLLKNFLHNGSNALIKTAIIRETGYFDPELKAAEDWDFYLRIAVRYHFVLVPKVQVIYRQSDSSMTANIKLMEQYLNIVIERAFRVAPYELQYLKQQSLAWAYKYLAQQYIKYQLDNFKGVRLAAENLCRAIFAYPPNILEPFTQSLTKRLIKNTLKQVLN
ncbi:MAG: glycosyltransferase [Cyanobacteria bacterium P01_E01_bin.35]